MGSVSDGRHGQEFGNSDVADLRLRRTQEEGKEMVGFFPGLLVS